jgi:hypothetical protein
MPDITMKRERTDRWIRRALLASGPAGRQHYLTRPPRWTASPLRPSVRFSVHTGLESRRHDIPVGEDTQRNRLPMPFPALGAAAPLVVTAPIWSGFASVERLRSPLNPRKRTLLGAVGTAERCQKRALAGRLYRRVRAGPPHSLTSSARHSAPHLQADGGTGLEIGEQLRFGGPVTVIAALAPDACRRRRMGGRGRALPLRGSCASPLHPLPFCLAVQLPLLP